MATIRATCPDCGDVEMTTEDVVVRICVDDNQGAYTFRCPRCVMQVNKPAEQRVVELLVSSGVALQTWALPAELGERPDGDPITHDELLDFHRILFDDAEWTDAVGRLVAGTDG